MKVAVLVLLSLAAGPPVRVVLLTRPGTLVETVVRLKAELGTAGFEVVEGPLEVAPAPRELAEAANAHQAAAVIALDGREGDQGVDVWVEDRLSDKTVARTVTVGQAATPALLALRAVDLLQASLLELTVRPPPEPVPAPVRALIAPVPAQVALREKDVTDLEEEPWTPRIQAQVGPVLLGQGGFDVAVGAQLSVHGRLTPHVWVGLLGLGPTALGDFQRAGRATVQQGVVAAEAQLHFEPMAWLQVSAGVGAGALYFTATATEGSTGALWSLLVLGDAGATFWFGDHVGVHAQATVAGALLPIRLLLQGVEVGRAADPLVAGTVGLAARF